jgi:uncharacterized membrane protein HdeD (DUF308 family)
MSDLTDLRSNWGWILAFGCISILLGMFAVIYSMVFTLVSVLFLAGMLIATGVIEAAYAIRHRERGHIVWYLLEALLAIAIGLLLLQSPVRGAIVLTMLLATYFVVAGIFRIVAALSLRLPNWGWTLFNGIATMALGIIVWGGWPVSSLWVLGLFIGITLIFTGWARVMLAVALRSHPLRPLTI